MKKLILILLMIAGLNTVADARDTVTRDINVLPVAARTTISNNFKSKVSLIKVEKTLLSISEYEVVLSDGSEITFDKNGNWKEVDVRRGKAVPSGFVPSGIKNYVQQKHKGQKIESIDKSGKGYDVELSNGIEMKFDKDGKFLRYD